MLGISRATLYRELSRGKVKQLSSDLVPYESYSADVAQSDYQAKGTAKGITLKIGNDHDFAKHVEENILIKKYSPDAVIMDLRVNGNPYKTDICTSTLYSYIRKGVFLNIKQSSLRRAGRIKKRRYEPVRPAYRGDGKSILERPKEAEVRSEAGHWEMDCIESGKGQGKACLLSLIERKTRMLILLKMRSQTQDSVVKALDFLEKEM